MQWVLSVPSPTRLPQAPYLSHPRQGGDRDQVFNLGSATDGWVTLASLSLFCFSHLSVRWGWSRHVWAPLGSVGQCATGSTSGWVGRGRSSTPTLIHPLSAHLLCPSLPVVRL